MPPERPVARPRRAWRGRGWLLGATVLAVLLGAGCSTIGYYVQTVHGHFAMLHAARPIDDLLADPAIDPALKAKLETAQQIRRFAVTELGEPDNGAFTSYADLKRPYVVWNVFATPELSLELHQSCFPVVGCLGYRGYFAKEDADGFAASLSGEGYDVNVGGVPAYSTLGWFNDPLLNTFMAQSTAEVARLVFHELAHQIAYASGDTMFNESYATAVETEGVKRWLASRNDPAATAAYAEQSARRRDFLGLLYATKDQLSAVYASPVSDDVKRAAKLRAFADLQSRFHEVREERWHGYAGYDRYFSQALNNAHLASLAAYTQWIPAFDTLLAEQHGDMREFHAQVRKLAELSREQRTAELTRLCPSCGARQASDRAAHD